MTSWPSLAQFEPEVAFKSMAEAIVAESGLFRNVIHPGHGRWRTRSFCGVWTRKTTDGLLEPGPDLVSQRSMR